MEPKAGAANDVGGAAAIDPARTGGADGAETPTDVPGVLVFGERGMG